MVVVGDGIYDGREAVTPMGSFFLHPTLQQLVNGVFGFKNPIDVDALKAQLRTSILRHPRFCSVLAKNGDGSDCWRRIRPEEVDLDRHVVVVSEEEELAGGEDFVNKYVGSLTIDTSLDMKRPLWEVHVLRSNRCCVFRVHHVLGDCTSFLALFLDSCQRVDDVSLPPSIPSLRKTPATSSLTKNASLFQRLLLFLSFVWYTIVYCTLLVLHSFWIRDDPSPITGGAGVELWPRMVRTLTIKLSDMKLVKTTFNGTINDVLLGIISLGLERYLELKNISKLNKPLRVTGLVITNLRPTSGLQSLESLMKSDSRVGWGNKFGVMLLPFYLGKRLADPIQHLRKLKEMTCTKKLSLEAIFSLKGYTFVKAVLGGKIAAKMNYNIISNTTFSVSNIMGPLDEMMFAGNPITYIRPTSTGLPQAMFVHMVSYMDKADIHIQVVKNIIPDPDMLVKCFEDALHSMKSSAMQINKKEGV